MKKIMAMVIVCVVGFIFLGSVCAADKDKALVLTAELNQTLTLPNGGKVKYRGLRKDPFEHPKLVKNQGIIKYIAYRKQSYFILEVTDPSGSSITYQDPIRGDSPAPIFVGQKKIVPIKISTQAIILSYQDPDREIKTPGIPGVKTNK